MILAPYGVIQMSFGTPHEDSPLDAPPLPGSVGILVVDEDPAFQLGLKTFLREYVGFEKVFTAHSGQEALDFIQAEPSIEVVTLDYRMPGMTGIEVLRNLQTQATRPLAILMITGYPSDELEAEFHSLRSDRLFTTHFLPKPVEFERLEHLVLEAHEEVVAAKRPVLDESTVATTPKVDEETPSPLSGIDEKFEDQASRLAAIEDELRNLRGKWRGDFWKLAFLALLFWLATQFGLIQKLEPHWNKIKETVSASFKYNSASERKNSPRVTPGATNERDEPETPESGRPL